MASVRGALLLLAVAGVHMQQGSAAVAHNNVSSVEAHRRTQSLVDGAVFPADAAVTLTASAVGTVALLARISALGTPNPAGRSYDGNAWEGVQPTALSFDCTAGDCTVFLPEYSGNRHRLPAPLWAQINYISYFL